jgi:hypothetical protein
MVRSPARTVLIGGLRTRGISPGHLRNLLDPWSLRKIQARTGIGRNAMKARFDGSTPLGMGDIELLAPLVRMTPEELFAELRKVGLPHLDSNQEPIGSQPGPLGELVDIRHARRLKSTREADQRSNEPAIVTLIAGRR